mmetsp:Transcript_11899/g.23082  ORF Transcript_11899/g.23082 Transcript_11899/m.23082 type:complete len:440 (+) Transcript_11899:37-1356(+)
MNANGTDAILQSISGMLQQAQAMEGGGQDTAQAALALADMVSGLAAQITGSTQGGAPPPMMQPPQEAPPETTWEPTPELPQEALGHIPTVEEFVAQNGLESWVVDALYLLRDDQRNHVMKSPLNLDHTTNLNGIITSRIKEVVPVDQRLQIFVTLNGLAQGVVDRLSTLTPDQHEKVMESTLKIQKANNPSGVAMRRITDVLRNERLGIPHGSGFGGPPQSRPPAMMDMQQGDNPLGAATNILTNLMSTLTGGGAPDPNQGGYPHQSMIRDRSRSRPPATTSTCVPPDVNRFLDDNSLEWWVGEVLARLSLWQRQNVMADLATVRNVRNPSGVVMARIKQIANVTEMLAIFIDLNQIDRAVAEELWALTDEQQASVMAPGIYIQNVRSSSVAARSRIRHVLAGNDAMGGAKRGGPSEYALSMGSMAMNSLDAVAPPEVM